MNCLVCDKPRSQWPRFKNGHMTGGRGLCSTCYQRLRNRGDIDQFPRLTMSREEVLDEWVFLHGQGYTYRDAAERLGMTFDAFYQTIRRAVRRGDERALPDRIAA